MADRKNRVVAPYVTFGVLLMGLGLWAKHDYDRLNEFRQAEMRQFADGLYHSVRAQWEGMDLDSDSGWQGQGQRLIDGLLASTPQLLGVSINVPNRTRLLAGIDTCRDCCEQATQGELVSAQVYWFWRPLGDQTKPPPVRAGSPGGGPAEPGPAPPNLVGPAPSLGMQPSVSSPAPPVLVLGLAKELPAPFREAELNAMVIRFSIALAAILALTVAWLQSIRSRALAGRLRLEQTRHAHVEELSLAAAGLAHETKNPLGIIRGIAQRMSDDCSLDSSCRESAERIIDAADQATGRLGEFISFAKVRTPHTKPVALHDVVSKCISLLAVDLEAANITTRIDGGSIWIIADEDMLMQILLNILLNSIQASGEGTRIVVRLENGQGKASLAITDQGRGVEEDLLDEVFKPYVTGREGGHGMGLTIVRRLVESHGWSITLESRPGHGTTARILGMEMAATPTEA